MATQSQCKLEFERRVNDNITFFNQIPGQNIKDQDEEIVFGYEETIIRNIKNFGTTWKDTIQYKLGDIVSFNNEIYVSRKDFNKNNSVLDSFFWLKKELKTNNTGIGYNITNLCFVKDEVVLSSFDTTYNTSGTVNYNFKFIFSIAASNSYTIPFLQPLDLRDTGKPTNNLLDFGVYPGGSPYDSLGIYLFTDGSKNDNLMSFFGAFIKM